MDFELKQFNNDTNWIKGTIGEYNFNAKHFDEGSTYGIDEGRVSKLEVFKGEFNKDGVIIHYARGWDKEPETVEHKELLEELINKLERLPKRFEAEVINTL